MKLRTLALSALTSLAAVAMLAPAADAHDGGQGGGHGHRHHHKTVTTVLTADLRGTNEVPANTLGGRGKATITLHDTTVCFALKTKTTTPAVAAHIHAGMAGVNGDVVIPLTAPNVKGKAKGCIENVALTIVADLIAHPDQFYVNVHTTALPGGDVRGQLKLHHHDWRHWH